MNDLVVQPGHKIQPDAAFSVRPDSFVIETNIHYPTECGYFIDGVRKFVPLYVEMARLFEVEGWRQSDHLVKKIKRIKQNIGRIAASKSQSKNHALQSLYRDMLKRVSQLFLRAVELVETVKNQRCPPEVARQIVAIEHWRNLTEQVSDTASRRRLTR
jgi:hypothetical protein